MAAYSWLSLLPPNDLFNVRIHGRVVEISRVKNLASITRQFAFGDTQSPPITSLSFLQNYLNFSSTWISICGLTLSTVYATHDSLTQQIFTAVLARVSSAIAAARFRTTRRFQSDSFVPIEVLNRSRRSQTHTSGHFGRRTPPAKRSCRSHLD